MTELFNKYKTVSYCEQIARQQSSSTCKNFLKSSLMTAKNLVVFRSVCAYVPKFSPGRWDGTCWSLDRTMLLPNMCYRTNVFVLLVKPFGRR